MDGDDIVPDGKDWTWILERRCPEWGFDAVAFDAVEDDRWDRRGCRSDGASFTVESFAR